MTDDATATAARAREALAWTRKAVSTADDLLTEWMTTGRVDHLEDRWYALADALAGSRPRLEEIEAGLKGKDGA